MPAAEAATGENAMTRLATAAATRVLIKIGSIPRDDDPEFSLAARLSDRGNLNGN